MTAEEFLTPEQEQRIIEAIRKAEKNTSGEIRVHLESKNKEKPSISYVWKVFDAIGMTHTKSRNGVLFYVDVNHKIFTIVGDKGIHQKVSDDFWNDVKDVVIQGFKNKKYDEALVKGILMVGEKLKKYFPYQQNDVNELPDEISKN
jgi:uncharacterized membrane protein